MAFLQHAFGSANDPKGVMVADGALTANLWTVITTLGLMPPMNLLRDPLPGHRHRRPDSGYESCLRRLGDRDPATVGIPGAT
ncbi:hypothetical protein AB0O28_14765 [Microbispora sp. NPDC088329]|uniref:hypothetical protein n=1 Tax=Microbispora sp. NPDC088329 TaxID=3154869 RepID=UPI00343387F7